MNESRNNNGSFFSSPGNGDGSLKQRLQRERIKGDQTIYIEELKRVNEELRQARRGALNLMEDAILSREESEKSEEKYRNLFDSMDEGYGILQVIYDPGGKAVDFRFLQVNSAFEKHSGLVNAAGKTILELQPALEPKWIEIYDRVAQTGESLRFEEGSDALGRFFSCYAFRVNHPIDRNVAVIFTDITDRFRREKNQAFLADLSQELVTLFGLEDTRNLLSEKIGKYFGVSACMFSELTDDMEFSVASNGWNAEGFPSLRGTYKMRDFLSNERLARYNEGELSIVNDTATDPDVNADSYSALGIRSFIIVPMLRDGTFQFQISIIDNKPRQWRKDEIELLQTITERVWARVESADAENSLSESEDRLKITMDTATDYAIITMDAERNIEKWSRGASEIFGYAEAEVLGQPADIIFTAEDRRAGVPESEVKTARETGSATDERWHLRKDGTRFFMNGVVRPIIIGQGITGYVKVARDMTPQQLFTEELQKQVQDRTVELKRSNEDLMQFAHVASHDLKEPVRKIKTFSNKIVSEFNDALPDMVKTYLQKIGKATDRMFMMIDGVLNYSRINYDNPPLEIIDLNNVLKEIISDLEVLIQQKNARIDFDSLPEIRGYRVPLYQLFYNLVLNSLKFSSTKDSPLIRITCETTEINGESFFKIVVSDNGIGFEHKYESAIFKTFTRLNPRDQYEGSGLGLALCRKIVDRHQGYISATGEMDKGAAFTVLLPANQNVLNVDQ